MKKEEITPTTDLQAIIPYETLPKMPITLEGVSVGDIPVKYWRKKPIFPANGFSIDMSPGEMRQMMNNCSAAKASDVSQLKRKVQMLFERPNEYATVSLCVRGMWDMYFKARNFPRGSEVMMTAINI